MRRHPHHGSDLLLGLSLAEIFMLFVLLIWLDAAVRAHAVHPRRQGKRTPTVEELQSNVDSLARESARYRGFSEIVPLQYRNLPADSLKRLVARGLSLASGGRGAPACYKNNVLFEADVLDGSTAVVIRSNAPPEALRELRDLGAPALQPGDRVRAMEQITALLGAIGRHNVSRPCRFDYVLNYDSNDDRVNGEDRFELYCYTASRKRIAR